MLVLAGDIGGTSTRLAFFQGEPGSLEVLAEEHYASTSAETLYEIVRLFSGRFRFTPERACFGIAGPIIGDEVRTPNLPWNIEGAQLARELGLPSVRLINDLIANTYGIASLKEEDLVTLNRGEADPTGTIAVVSAGTGLGEAFAYWDGSTHRPLPSEAGHADFAPRDRLEAELLHYLAGKFGRVSYERVISGPGLVNIYRFLRDVERMPERPETVAELGRRDPGAVITETALRGECPLCARAVDIFVSLYGAECGNAALRFLATGGVYLGGGIAPHILERLKQPLFVDSFTKKGRLSPLLLKIPVRVILNDRTALLGAARAAALQKI